VTAPFRLLPLRLAVIGLAAWWLAAPGWAQGGAPYTVQVAALSDSDAAIELSGVLLRGGFPSYVVRAEGAAGSVFRVRVGAFGDRISADRYARAMGFETPLDPRPALAEAIPSGILPLAPVRWFRLESGQSAEVVVWTSDARAARIEHAGGATRYLLEDGRAFDAWWARALPDGGREEVASVPLDAASTQDEEEAVRDALFRQRIRLVAERAGLDAETLEREAVRGEVGERSMIVWRRIPAGGGEETVLGVLRREAPVGARDPDAWLGEVPPEPDAALARLDEATAGPVDGEAVSGDGWSARSDGPWTLLTVGTPTWRALVGAPRVALGDVLVVRVDGGLEALRLRPR
jgi:hypothetical protein